MWVCGYLVKTNGMIDCRLKATIDVVQEQMKIQDYWEAKSKMKVLLTGATGFLGSHILKRLIEKNIEIVVLKRSFSKDNRIVKYGSRYKVYDIDRISLQEIFEKESKIDAVIHCATNYGRKNDKASEVFLSNVVFPLQLLEVATFFNADTFFNTDTTLNKTNSVKGHMQNYILTKKQFLEWGKLFAETDKINFVNLKLEHIYGEGDDDSKFTSFVIHSCLNNVNKIDLTDGEQLRDFVYIDDVVSAYLTVLLTKRKLEGYHEYEVGSGKAVKVKDLVNAAKRIARSKTILNFGAIPHRDNEILYSQADISKLKELGWNPTYDLENGIKEYIDNIKKLSL